MKSNEVMPPQTRVLIADDHPIVLEGLSGLIEDEPDMLVVGEAKNGYEAVELYMQRQPDVVLMDLRMPEMEGVEAIQRIRQHNPTACIIVLTTYDTDQDIYTALRAGAMAYLLKDTSRVELLNTIRGVCLGQKHISPSVALKFTERLKYSELTARELEVLQLISDGKSSSEIGAALYIVESTVKTHIKTILRKLNVSDRTQAVMVALKRGIIRLN